MDDEQQLNLDAQAWAVAEWMDAPHRATLRQAIIGLRYDAEQASREALQLEALGNPPYEDVDGNLHREDRQADADNILATVDRLESADLPVMPEALGVELSETVVAGTLDHPFARTRADEGPTFLLTLVERLAQATELPPGVAVNVSLVARVIETRLAAARVIDDIAMQRNVQAALGEEMLVVPDWASLGNRLVSLARAAHPSLRAEIAVTDYLSLHQLGADLVSQVSSTSECPAPSTEQAARRSATEQAARPSVTDATPRRRPGKRLSKEAKEAPQIEPRLYERLRAAEKAKPNEQGVVTAKAIADVLGIGSNGGTFKSDLHQLKIDRLLIGTPYEQARPGWNRPTKLGRLAMERYRHERGLEEESASES